MSPFDFGGSDGTVTHCHAEPHGRTVSLSRCGISAPTRDRSDGFHARICCLRPESLAKSSVRDIQRAIPSGGMRATSVDDDFVDPMARAKAGDQAAIRLFLSRFGREVQMMVRLALCRRSYGTSMTPLISCKRSGRVSLRSFRDRAEFLEAAHLRRYLGGVARNKIFEQHRRLTRTKKYDICRENRLYIRRGDRRCPCAT